MAAGKKFVRGEGAAGLADWAMFAVLVVIGGSSFAMIRGAVESIPPAVITVGRLWVGAIFMVAVMIQARRKLPRFIVATAKGPRIHRAWMWMMAIAAVGYVAPFYIFPWAQQYIDSGLAGVYMAFMPIWTLVLAYFFANEKLRRNKLIGFGLGFLGVLILMGPDVIGGAASASILAQGSLLLATFSYAAYAVMTRRAPAMRPRVFAAGTMICAAVLSTPFLLAVDLKIDQWTLAGIANVVALGLGPTGVASLLLILMIRRVGAGFMSLANYIVPLWAVIMGAVIFGERLEPQVFVALAIILAGVAISQRKEKSAGMITKAPRADHLANSHPSESCQPKATD